MFDYSIILVLVGFLSAAVWFAGKSQATCNSGKDSADDSTKNSLLGFAGIMVVGGSLLMTIFYFLYEEVML